MMYSVPGDGVSVEVIVSGTQCAYRCILYEAFAIPLCKVRIILASSAAQISKY